ncbi:Vitamin B12 import ATP-binding protein BtuD [Actinosynnema sp. ALI-1.44]
MPPGHRGWGCPHPTGWVSRTGRAAHGASGWWRAAERGAEHGGGGAGANRRALSIRRAGVETCLTRGVRQALGFAVVSPHPQHPAVEVSGLVKRYGSTVAVNGLDLTLPRGEVLALLGPNGAGKTSTVEVCEGFRRADGGTVRVLGLDPRSPALRPRIGVMPQGGGGYPGVRADEMLRLVAACAADPLDPAWLLDVLGLTNAKSTPYKRLSGGQQQRLSLACALVGRPELVFLDEPTAGMDPQARRLVWELVAALKNDGVSVLLTTHLMDEAEALADHVVIVDRGQVVAAGTPRELTALEDQQLRFRARPGLDLSLLVGALPEGMKVREASPGGYLVQGRIDPQVVSTVTSWCAQQGVLAEELTVAKRSLEDVFLDLTGRELRS